MKNLLLIILWIPSFFFSQNFTWLRGSTVSGQSGIYGTQGVSSPTIDPGARHGSGTWTDLNGDLWMFGGEGYSSTNNVAWLSDLWKYSVSTNQWTWMGGSNLANQASVYGTMGTPAASNQPGAREFPICWVDNAGKFWMLGGLGFGSSPSQNFPQRMGDLWKYDPLTNLWTWMNGFNTNLQNGIYGTLQTPSANNMPGCRMGSASWTDASGNLWLFGGRGFPATGPSEGFLNDLWRYNVNTNQWTWMGGSNQTGITSVYGTQGIPSATNMPGGKEFPASWIDNQDNLYLFGGRSQGYFSDLWRYSMANGTWTWIKGPNLANQTGIYGTITTAAAANTPGGRFAQAAWTDKYGQFWLFGGQGWSGFQTSVNNLNDLWKYDPCSNNWTWMKGSDTLNQSGVYGTQGISATANMPGSRFYNNSWTSKDRTNLWLIGGEGFDASSPSVDHMNDVWRYDVVTPGDSAYNLGGPTVCTGNQASLTVAGATGLTWYSSPTSTSVLFSGSPYVTPQLSAITSPSLYTFYAQVSCNLRPRTSAQVTVQPIPTISISNQPLNCEGNFTLTAGGAATYTWINGSSGATATFSNTGTSFTAVVLGTSAVGCEGSATKVVSLSPAPILTITASSTVACTKELISLNSLGAASYTWNTGVLTASLSASATTAGLLSYSVTGKNLAGCAASASISLKFDACTGLRTEHVKNNVKLFPNPSNGQVTIESGLTGEKTILIRNVSGQVVSHIRFETESAVIDEKLSPGIYFLTLTTAESEETLKLIVN